MRYARGALRAGRREKGEGRTMLKKAEDYAGAIQKTSRESRE
jgi:hypothetical protein